MSHELIQGDCLEVIPTLASREIKLIIADPPYNFDEPYDSHHDNLPAAEFLTWTEKWLTAIREIIHPEGSIWIFSPDEWVSEIDVFCKQKLKLHKRRQVIWYFTFGQASQKNFTRSHVHLLYYTVNKTKFTFNANAIRVPSARSAVYGDKRANPQGKLPDATWILLKQQMDEVFQSDQDTWLESRVCGTYKERREHSPNQIPVSLLERIVLSTSNPGDLVCDPFAGSASTGVACLLHQRHFVGTDVSPRAIEYGKQRLAQVNQGV